MAMFDKIISRPVRTRKAKAIELPKTIAFLTCVVKHGARLAYGGLAEAANALGEDESGQIRHQRGSSLVNMLPAELQPFVCRKEGGYHKKAIAKWTVTPPADLTDRPVIAMGVEGAVAKAAVDEWQESLPEDSPFRV